MRTENISVQVLQEAAHPFGCGRRIGRKTRGLLLSVAVLFGPAVLVGCSSSVPQREASTSYPPQSRAALPGPAQPGVPVAVQTVSASGQVAGTALTGLAPPRSASSASATPNFTPAQTNLSAAAAQPTSLSPTPVVDGAAAKPAAPPPEEFDAAASAYPSVALFDLFRENAAAQGRPANPPLLSDSVTGAPATGQAAAAAPPVQSAATGTAAQPPAQSAAANNAPAAPAASTSDDFDPAASAYPSVALFDLFRNNKPNQ